MRTIPFFLLAACGSQTPNTATPDAGLDVAGHWVSDCTPTGDGKAIALDFHNSADHWQVAYVTYGDAACTTPIVTANIAGTYTIGGASKTAGAREAVFHFDTKTLTPNVQALADALDGMDCGGGFNLGRATDVYAHGCAGFGMYPQATCSADYDLVAISGDTLRFGNRPADNNMCSAEKRPTELSPIALHRK